MSNIDGGGPRHANALIERLPRIDRERVIRRSEECELEFRAVVNQPGETIRYVYFPLNGYISLITPAVVTGSIEIGMIGNEGMFGMTLLLDVKTSPLQALVQGAGAALRLSSRRFLQEVDESMPLRKTLNKYMYVLTSQIAQTAACNSFHRLDARLARWLLMSADRAYSNSFRLTHEFLAHMLGVRRTGVTEAAGRLQEKGLIRYARGEVNVLDRGAVMALACPCYEALSATYAKHLGKPLRRSSSSGAVDSENGYGPLIR